MFIITWIGYKLYRNKIWTKLNKFEIFTRLLVTFESRWKLKAFNHKNNNGKRLNLDYSKTRFIRSSLKVGASEWLKCEKFNTNWWRWENGNIILWFFLWCLFCYGFYCLLWISVSKINSPHQFHM